MRRDINGVGADRDVETGIIMIDGGMWVIERCGTRWMMVRKWSDEPRCRWH